MRDGLKPRSVAAWRGAAEHVFRAALRRDGAFGKPVRGRLPNLQNDASAIIGRTGDVVGTVVLSLPAATASKIVECFVGSPIDIKNVDFADAVGELVNMISGGATAKFDGQEVRISCPSVVIGQGHTVQQPSGSVSISIPCESSCGGFSVDVSIKKVGVSQASEPAAA